MNAAVITHKGGKKNLFNQDYIKLHKNIIICCDGHGKVKINNYNINTGVYCSYVIGEFMSLHLDYDNIENSFKKAQQYLFHKIKKLLLNKQIKIKINKKNIYYLKNNKWKHVAGGTTATIVIYNKENSSITVSNVGDCIAILFDTTNNTFKILTEDHSPFSYSDYLNLKEKFNFCYAIMKNKKINFSLNLYNKNGKKNDPPENCKFKNVRNEPYVLVKPKNKSFGLNMTRSLGDFALSQIGISHIPATKKYNIKKNDILLIASDGFTDNYKFNQLSNLINSLSHLNVKQILDELLKDVLIKQKKNIVTEVII